jgi:putative hydrolase of HD superfamily
MDGVVQEQGMMRAKGLLEEQTPKRPVLQENAFVHLAREVIKEMEALARFFFEAGLLKRIKRSGWWVAGVKDPESVAEHSFRTALLGYVLALLEGADPFRTAAICILHDLPEARIGDLHRLNDRYLDSTQAQIQALADQLAPLPELCTRDLSRLYKEWELGESPEALVARDADLLECLIQAREYQAQGCSSVQEWINNTASRLQTNSAKAIARACMEGDPKEWWHLLSG